MIILIVSRINEKKYLHHARACNNNMYIFQKQYHVIVYLCARIDTYNFVIFYIVLVKEKMHSNVNVLRIIIQSIWFYGRVLNNIWILTFSMIFYDTFMLIFLLIIYNDKYVYFTQGFLPNRVIWLSMMAPISNFHSLIDQ